jgi:hypothetical protein
MSHKFSLGQAVVFTPGACEVLNVATKGTITRLLPKDGTDYQYHVQVDPDGPARRARENQLQPVTLVHADVRPAMSPLPPVEGSLRNVA